ncbi:hypothetical protein H8356DRAFT_1351859 [Neocallimastix lanati (nom. inval.)]|nr:hypothetical protein H8356DRAFT_1351859 [Neocallimastix sp. JGI-2020a]
MEIISINRNFNINFQKNSKMLVIEIIVMFHFQIAMNPTGTSVLRISIATNSSTALSLTINEGRNSSKVANFIDDVYDSTFELEFKFRPNDFKVGENKISLNERQEDILLITNLMNNYKNEKCNLQIEFDFTEKDVSKITIHESIITMKNESNKIYNEI